MSEPEQDKRIGQGDKGLSGYVYEPRGEFRRRREGRRRNGAENLSGSEAIPNVSGPNSHKIKENHLNKGVVSHFFCQIGHSQREALSPKIIGKLTSKKGGGRALRIELSITELKPILGKIR